MNDATLGDVLLGERVSVELARNGRAAAIASTGPRTAWTVGNEEGRGYRYDRDGGVDQREVAAGMRA